MDNLRRVLIGLEPIPRETEANDKAIVEAFRGTGLLEGYEPEDEPKREQATLQRYS